MATRRRTPPLTAEQLLAGYPPEIRGLVDQLRGAVRRTIPTAKEVVYPGWKALGYRDPHCGYFCGIFPQFDRVQLAFEHGARLPDPDGVLEGSGKQVRYLVVRSAKDIRPRSLSQLLRAAVMRR